MPEARSLLRVALPVPLADGFDYWWVGAGPPPPVGARVRVPFGRSERIGLVLEHPDSSNLAANKLKDVLEQLDDSPVLGKELLATLAWAAEYYHHPIGEVLSHALPVLLRKGRPLTIPKRRAWTLTDLGREQSPQSLAPRAKQQAGALAMLAAQASIADADMKAAGFSADTLSRLASKSWISPCTLPGKQAPASATASRAELPALSNDQRSVLAQINAHTTGFASFLLHGVTSSGKTEVYLRLIGDRINQGKQSLLLVPEISLTPQLVRRLEERFGAQLALLHSGLTERERFDAWRRAYQSEAHLIVGTRSAVFAPLPAAGLIIVDEEHDTAYKQEHGLRYSARDLAVVRARRLKIPVLLGSATPSLESYRNGLEGRYRLLTMPNRIGKADKPAIRIIDLNKHASRQALSTPLIAAIEGHLADGNQVLLFINRRGFAPSLFCPECEQAQECEHCDSRMTVHARAGRLRCHHCGREQHLRWACPRCGSERIGVGAGTQRVSDELAALFPDRKIARLDRDVTARRGALHTVLDDLARGDTQILVGTQMLTKGHDFPRVTLVGVLNADQGLFGTDFRSDERLAQTIVQVAGRAGRGTRAGEVMIQTHYPAHPLLNSLLSHDYASFAEFALKEREQAQWPPYSHVAVWRAEAPQRDRVFEFLNRLLKQAENCAENVELFGPAAAPMERMSGRFRAQLLFQSRARPALHDLLDRTLPLLRAWPEARRVRWSLDVDPIAL